MSSGIVKDPDEELVKSYDEPPPVYGISWAQAGSLFKGLTGKDRTAWVGICLRNRRVSHLCASGGSFLTAEWLWRHDTYVDEAAGTCEEASRCLDRLCPLNRTTWMSLCQAHGITGKQPEHWDTQLGPTYNFEPDGTPRVFECAGPERGSTGLMLVPQVKS